MVKMAGKNKSANLCESVEESILNVTQDDLISTNINESVDNTTDEITIETVDAKSSRIDNVDVLSQLALFMEMMSSKFDQQNEKFDQQNTNLNEFRTEVKSEINVINMSLNELKSENNNLNASLNEFKIEIKSEINAY